jgi:uncharacterized membrane protein
VVLPAVAIAIVGFVMLSLGIGLVAQAPRWSRVIAVADRQVMQALGGALRVLMGLVLVYGARETRYPAAVNAFGLVLVVVGVMILSVSTPRFESWVDRWVTGSLVWRLRVGGLLSTAVGVFLVWAAIS